MKPIQWIAGSLLLGVAACSSPPAPQPVVDVPPAPAPVSPPPPPPVVSRGINGTYAGALNLVRSSASQQCPEANGGQATMTVQNGRARIDMTEGMSFTGRVGRNGQLTLSSNGGPSSRLFGRLAGGRFNARGSGECTYAARLVKQPG